MNCSKITLFCIGALMLLSCRKPRTREKKTDTVTSELVKDTDDKMQDIAYPNSSDGVIVDEELPISDDKPSNQVYFGDSLPIITDDKPSQIIKRLAYITSYNINTKNANWVTWHLTREHTTGKWSRDGVPYMVDEDVVGPRQELEDWYVHSLPIDHGHLCPAGDNKWSKEAMFETFYLTNMCPQNSSLNHGDWEELESRCRGWAKKYGDIYIVAGPIFYNAEYKIIGNNVGVPDAFFKVVLCTNKRPKALGFIYPNEHNNQMMSHYLASVDEVEEVSNIDFFSFLEDSIEDKIEAEPNLNIW